MGETGAGVKSPKEGWVRTHKRRSCASPRGWSVQVLSPRSSPPPGLKSEHGSFPRVNNSVAGCEKHDTK